MANEQRGLYVMIGGTLFPAATVPGSKGDRGDKGNKGDKGDAGPAAVGVVVAPVAPASPQVGTVWLNTAGT